MAFADYEEFAADYRRQCAAQRAREEEWKSELAWLDKVAKSRTVEATEAKIEPDAVRKTDVGNGAGGLVKTRDDARVASESPKQQVVTPPNVAPNETAVWWQWTDERIAYALEAHCFNDTQRDVLAQLIAEIRHEWRDGDSAAKREFEREVGFFKREIEQVQRQVDIQIELQAQAKSLRDEITVAKDRAIEAEQMNLRRELSLLRQEIAVAKGLEALKADVAQARADVPQLPDIEARIDARQADVEGKQARLERELARRKISLASCK
jgi:hypothetical protein